MASASLKKGRTSRSKAEVQEEFHTLVMEEKLAKEEESAKNESARLLKETEVRNAISNITVELINQKIADLTSEISKSLSLISEKMNGEVKLLMQMQEAVSLEAQELKRLHAIDIAATSIDQLITDYQAKKQSLETEMQSIREKWAHEQQEWEKSVGEQDENLKKNRTREQEEYEYKKFFERKKIEDKYEEECYLRDKKNQEKQEALEKNWNEREESLKLREDELLRLRKEVELFPTKLSSESAKAVNVAIIEVERKFSQEIADLKKDIHVEKQLAELKIKGLQETITAQQSQMKILQTQLEEAKKQVQDIAIKAIEGASGAKALSHINEIAIEQAKNRGTTT